MDNMDAAFAPLRAPDICSEITELNTWPNIHFCHEERICGLGLLHVRSPAVNAARAVCIHEGGGSPRGAATESFLPSKSVRIEKGAEQLAVLCWSTAEVALLHTQDETSEAHHHTVRLSDCSATTVRSVGRVGRKNMAPPSLSWIDAAFLRSPERLPMSLSDGCMEVVRGEGGTIASCA